MSRGSANDKDAVEIVATVQHRRRWSVSEKIRMVEDTERPGMSVSCEDLQTRLCVSSLRYRWIDGHEATVPVVRGLQRAPSP